MSRFQIIVLLGINEHLMLNLQGKPPPPSLPPKTLNVPRSESEGNNNGPTQKLNNFPTQKIEHLACALMARTKKIYIYLLDVAGHKFFEVSSRTT